MASNSSFRTLTADNIEGVVTSKNYLKSSFENGTTTGWSLFSTTLTGGLPTGTISAGAASLALTTTSTNPIDGAFSLQLSAAGVATAGHGIISDVFTLSNGDLGKMLNSKFSYNVVSGATNLNFSGLLGSQTIAVAFRDVTSSVWIPAPVGYLGMNQGTGYSESSPISFQSSVTVGQQYQMAIYFSQASAGATTLTFDNFVCSKTVITSGYAGSDWVSYTPTVSNLGSGGGTATGKYRRVGDSAEVYIRFSKDATAGTNSGLAVTFSIPSGLSVDTTKITSLSGRVVVGTADLEVANTNPPAVALLFNSYGSNLILTGNFATIDAVGTFFGSNQTANLTAMVPIVGWSSNVAQSSDSDQRVYATKVYQALTTSIATGDTKVPFTAAATYDTAGMYSTTNSNVVIPATGFYDIEVALAASPGAANSYLTAVVYRNNSFAENLGVILMSATGPTFFLQGNKTILCNAGDVVDIRARATTACNLSSDISNTFFTITKRSGPAVVQATESVNARYLAVGTQSVTATTQTRITIFTSKDYDSHAAYNPATGYVVPVSGKYRMGFSMGSNATNAVGAGAQFQIYVAKTTVAGQMNSFSVYSQSTTANGYGGYVSDEINCIAGDLLIPCVFQNLTNPLTIGPGLGAQSLTITRVGN